MPGIVEGFQQGYNFTDNVIRQNENDQLRKQMLQTQADQTAFQNKRDLGADARAQAGLDLQSKQVANTEKHYANQETQAVAAGKRADATLGLAQSSEWRAQREEDRKSLTEKRALLAKQADFYWRGMENGTTTFPADLHKQLVAVGMPQYSPYSLLDPQQVDSYDKAGAVLHQLGTGGIDKVNDPAVLANLNQVYADQINAGIGEFNGPMGGKVVSKNIAQLHAAPGGNFVADVNVQLENGKTYTAPVTIHRTTHPDDPVRLNAAGSAMDDLAGRAMLGQMARDPTYRAKIVAAHDVAFGANQNDANLPANAKMIEYLMTRGKMTFDAAQQLVLNSKDNPEKFVNESAIKIAAAEAKDPTTNKRPLADIAAEIRQGLGIGGAAPVAAAPTQAAPAGTPSAPAPGGNTTPVPTKRVAPAQGKVITMADVQATAASSGRTQQEVIQAAEAKGYTLQQ